MKVDAVIFDVDGTLWDTTDLVAEAWIRAVADFGITREEPVTGADLKREFGKPMNEIMNNLFPGEEEQTKVDVLKVCCEYEHDILEKYEGSLLYPSVKEVFRVLAEKHKVCVVSNCQSGYIELFLKKNHLEQYVTDMECYGDTLLSKGENIKLVMERNQIKDAIYVGDTIGDYNASVYAGIPFVYVDYGFGIVKTPDKRISDLIELLELVK